MQGEYSKMKTIFLIVILMLVSIPSAFAWSLAWDDSVGATGYKIYYHELDNPGVVTEIDVGNVTIFSLDNEELTKGIRYEFWCTAYNATDESSHSNHLRWTYPKDPVIIETLEAPTVFKIIIEAK